MGVRPESLVKAIALILTGAAIHALMSRNAVGPCYQPPAAAVEGSAAAFDPFEEGPNPLKIIKVASKGHDKPLFQLPDIWMSVHHHEYISSEMESNLYGPSWWFKMVGAVQKDKLLVDVGFNIGGVGIVAAAQGMRVIGFEPVRKNWVLGQQSIRLNHLQNRVTLYHAAVHWSGEKMRIMHNFSVEPDGMLNAGQGTLGKRTDADVKNLDANMYEDVDTISLSDAVREDVWLMKLDVEGCECHCLRTADVLFQTHNVNYVFIETDPAASARCGCAASFFVDFFKTHGYGTCKQFEGTKQGPERSCADMEPLTASTWFQRHDRWLRKMTAPLLPGKPMV